jgi:uncharacterized membrane protein
MSAISRAGYDRTVEERQERRDVTRQVEARISVILRTGVLTAAALLAVSQPWIILQKRPGGSPGLSVGEALRRLPQLDPRGIAALGVIILVATPILQLLTSAFLFWRKHDRLYVGLTLAVCAIVAFGALFTTGGH